MVKKEHFIIMLMETDVDLQSSSIDFTSLESVEFYGGYGPINPDRVYIDQENRLVAFFSREKCGELKNYLHDSAKDFYSSNRALLIVHGSYFEDAMNSASINPKPKAKHYFFSGLKSLVTAPYSLVTNSLILANDRSGNVMTNMSRRSRSCAISNAIFASRYNNYKSSEIDGCFFGIEVGVGRSGDVAQPAHYIMDPGLEFQPPNSLDEIIRMVIQIENIFQNANKDGNTADKNYASYLLSRLNEIFHQNFERRIKYQNFFEVITREQLQIMLIRKYINFLVLAYRWMSTNVNLFGTGNIKCLKVFMHNCDAYYFNHSDTEYLADRMMLKVQTEVSRYLNSFNLEIVSKEFMDNCLGQNAQAINTLKKKAQKINKKIEEIDNKIDREMNKISLQIASSISATAITGSLGLLLIPDSVNTSKFSKLMKSREKNEREYNNLQHAINVNVEFREMIYLHLQLQFIKTYFPRFSGIIITIKGNSYEKKYNVQLLL